MVDPDPSVAHGYADGNGGVLTDWGRDVPSGGTLDPVSRLVGAAAGGADRRPEAAGASRPAAARGSPSPARSYDDATGRVATLPRPAGAPDRVTGAAWADGRLLAFGGADTSLGYGTDALTNGAWLFTP